MLRLTSPGSARLMNATSWIALPFAHDAEFETRSSNLSSDTLYLYASPAEFALLLNEQARIVRPFGCELHLSFMTPAKSAGWSELGTYDPQTRRCRDKLVDAIYPDLWLMRILGQELAQALNIPLIEHDYGLDA